MDGLNDFLTADGFQGRTALLLISSVLLGSAALFFWRPIFRVFIRVFTLIYRVFRRIFLIFGRIVTRVLSALRLTSRRVQTVDPKDVAISVSGKVLIRSEIDVELAKRPDVDAPDMSGSRAFFYSVDPMHSRTDEYNDDKAREDFEHAKDFFSTKIPNDSNALNLYDDIHGAAIIRMFHDSDYRCFYTLSEVRKAINANAFNMYLIFSTVLALVFVLNVTLGDAIDFLTIVGLQSDSSLISALSQVAASGTEQVVFNKFVFGAISNFLALAFMWLCLKFYQQSQTLNGKGLNNYMNNYLNVIKVRASRVEGSARDAIVVTSSGGGNGSSVGGVGSTEAAPTPAQPQDGDKAQSLKWVENLHWMAMRVFYIQQFFRIMMFQAHRNSLLASIFVPIGFIVIFAVASAFFAAPFWTTDGMIGPGHSSFYVLYPLLLAWVAYRFSEAMLQVGTQIKDSWTKFDDMELISSMNRILVFYEQQLSQWKDRFSNRGGGIG